MKKLHLIFIAVSLVAIQASAAEKTTLRIGVQTSGTLDWELSVLPESSNFQIQAQPVATAEAAKIALQSGAVDMIVSDFLWVSQTRNTGAEFTFYPYSNTSGTLVVPANSAIHDVKDLAGKRLGIAGGELDKNWLLLQAVGKKQNVDLNATVEKIFGAPPLINEQLKNQRVDAVLTHWHFAAQLEAQGYRQLLDGKTLQQDLGIAENVPTLGYVFKQSWADSHKTALKAFFAATSQAKNRLCDDAALWQKTTIKMQFAPEILHQRYCDGRVNSWTTANQLAAQQLYSVLFNSNPKVGNSPNLAAGTFWIAD
ncbi:MAG: transporter substrate-binding domain-containing protein [Methylococcales bacterium]|nr:transporter substrate-binding domain-containing protein [Methylococcales bacterium]MDD5753631.1 transporter substrate-binding domain-containing protein [Methylococcales bacterium]